MTGAAKAMTDPSTSIRRGAAADQRDADQHGQQRRPDDERVAREDEQGEPKPAPIRKRGSVVAYHDDERVER